MANKKPESALDLRALDGPSAGTVVRLDPDEPLLIGRTNRGLHLADPTVSLEHAEIAWETECYWLVDLRSRTGTFVDGAPIGGAPVRLVPGMEIAIGESLLRVEARSERPAWAYPLIAGSAAVIVGCGMLVYSWVQPVSYEPSLRAPAPVSMGVQSEQELRLPIPFVRRTGMDHRQLEVDRVTDFDDDGISEVWITGGERAWVITFDKDGTWRELGALPAGCRDLRSVRLPVLRCGVDLLQFDEEAQRYVVVGQEGVVAWLQPPPEPDPEESKPRKEGKQPFRPAVGDVVVPHLGTLTQPKQLAGFLADRGVHEPVHYLVCEGAFPDVSPQVLTVSGKQIPLPVGCIRDIELSGTFPRDHIGSSVPGAVAFTATGRQALIDDYAMLIAGNAEEMFLGPKDRQRLETVSMEPVRLGTVLLEFMSYGAQPDFDPVAGEVPLEGERRLITGDRRTAAPLAHIVDLPGPGAYRIDLPGCEQLEVKTLGWTCAIAKWCRSGSPFVDVRQVGCDRQELVVRGAFANSRWRGRTEGLEVEVEVDGSAGANRFDVLRTRVAYREAEAPPEDGGS